MPVHQEAWKFYSLQYALKLLLLFVGAELQESSWVKPGASFALPGSPRMVKYGRHSVKPELCRTQLLHSP